MFLSSFLFPGLYHPLEHVCLRRRSNPDPCAVAVPASIATGDASQGKQLKSSRTNSWPTLTIVISKLDAISGEKGSTPLEPKISTHVRSVSDAQSVSSAPSPPTSPITQRVALASATPRTASTPLSAPLTDKVREKLLYPGRVNLTSTS